MYPLIKINCPDCCLTIVQMSGKRKRLIMLLGEKRFVGPEDKLNRLTSVQNQGCFLLTILIYFTSFPCYQCIKKQLLLKGLCRHFYCYFKKLKDIFISGETPKILVKFILLAP